MSDNTETPVATDTEQDAVAIPTADSGQTDTAGPVPALAAQTPPCDTPPSPGRSRLFRSYREPTIRLRVRDQVIAVSLDPTLVNAVGLKSGDRATLVWDSQQNRLTIRISKTGVSKLLLRDSGVADFNKTVGTLAHDVRSAYSLNDCSDFYGHPQVHRDGEDALIVVVPMGRVAEAVTAEINATEEPASIVASEGI